MRYGLCGFGGPYSKNVVTKWYLYNGHDNIEIGKRLPREYKQHEYMMSCSPDGIINRILASRKPDEDLIKNG